jgi:hypothetical protein
MNWVGLIETWVLVVVVVLLYWLPFIIAKVRDVPDVGTVFVVNLLTGWTFIGWVVALALAARSRR